MIVRLTVPPLEHLLGARRYARDGNVFRLVPPPPRPPVDIGGGWSVSAREPCVSGHDPDEECGLCAGSCLGTGEP